jgi:integrase
MSDTTTGKRHKRIVARERRPNGRLETDDQLRRRAEGTLDALRALIARPATEREGWTVRDYAIEQYLPAVRQAGRKRTTLDNYAVVLDRYVFPTLGSIELAKLTADHVNAMDATLLGYAVSTRRAARAALNRVLRHAVKAERLARNVIERAGDLPDDPDEPREVLEGFELRALLDAARGTEWEAMVAVLVFCGLRRGEVLGLSWDALDLDRATLTVAHNLVPTSAGLQLGPPKTKRSRRTLTDLDPALISVLRSARARQAEARLRAELWSEHEIDHRGRPVSLVFTDEVGRPIGPHRLTSAVKRLAREAGIERASERMTGPHCLRHAYASHRIAAGDPIPAVSADLGHSSPQITMTVYSHVITANRPAATSAVAAAIGAW